MGVIKTSEFCKLTQLGLVPNKNQGETVWLLSGLCWSAAGSSHIFNLMKQPQKSQFEDTWTL